MSKEEDSSSIVNETPENQDDSLSTELDARPILKRLCTGVKYINGTNSIPTESSSLGSDREWLFSFLQVTAWSQHGIRRCTIASGIIYPIAVFRKRVIAKGDGRCREMMKVRC